MLIANRESFAVASTRRRLPYDSRVEYLQSSGTQYIDTGYTPSADTNVVISFSVTSVQATQGIFGQRTAALNNSLLLLQYKRSNVADGWQLRWDRGAGSLNVLSPVAGQRYTGTSKGSQFTLDGTTVDVDKTISGGYSLYLFAVNQSGSPILLAPSLRVYSFAIFSRGILVHDYVPVRKGDAGYLYDRITGRLLGNAGTGDDFVIGPDKMPWINPYVTDGLVAMWDVEQGYTGDGISDLVGGYDIAITGAPTLGSSGQYLNLGGGTTLRSAVVPFASTLNRTTLTGWTVEVVATVNTIVADAVVVNYDYQSSSHRGLSVRHGGSYYAQTIEYLQNTYKIVNGGSSSTRVISIVGDSTNNTATNAVAALFDNTGNKYTARGSITAADSRFVFGYGAKDNWYCARVYNRKLSYAERTANYNADRERFGLS